jgi:hypothetical protein
MEAILKRRLVALGVSLVLLTGCSLSQLATDQTASLLATGSVALDRESDLVFARDAMPGSLKTIETFLINSPNNKDLLFLLTKGFNAYALLFLEADLERARLEGTDDEVDELNRRAVLHYLRARTYGFVLLNYVELEEAALSGNLQGLDAALAGLQKEDAPALFWTTQAWASAINLSQDDPDMVGALPVVEKMMLRVMELDPNYLAGSPYIFMGSYYASRPRMFGGDPEKAQKYFQTALERHGEVNLLVPYMCGRLYAVQVQDRALFKKMMAKVLEAEVVEHPDFRLQNEAARARARFWVEHVDDLFFE